MSRPQFSLMRLLWLVRCAALTSPCVGAAYQKGRATSSLIAPAEPFDEKLQQT